MLGIAIAAQKLVSQNCLGCICQSASGCPTVLGCAGDTCGPFHLTQGYWKDGGMPTLNNEANNSPDGNNHQLNKTLIFFS